MPNTKITRQKWKDHYSYAKKVYIIAILVSIGVASLIFTVTRYIAPNERAVAIELVDSYVDAAKLEQDIPILLEKGQEFDSSLEEVTFLSIPYSGSSSEYEGSQVYGVQVYAGDNDIFIQNEMLTNSMYDQNFIVPLDTLEGFEAFKSKYPDVIVWKEEPRTETEDGEASEEDEDTPIEAEPVVMHAYALDMSSLTGFNQRGAIDIRGKYAVITCTSKNPATSFHVLAQMFELFQPEEANQ